jgi:DNA-binding response OmpR family regulator
VPTAARKSILVVDDDTQLLSELKSFLAKLGYEVATAETARAALAILESTVQDLIVLDINLPDSSASRSRTIDGIEMLRTLRETSNLPVLMLSSTNSPAVKVMALTIGADDYVAKPFEIDELGARIEAILRRTRQELPGERVLEFRRLRLDPGERRVWKDDGIIELTEIEFDILYTMARRPEHVFTRDKIVELAWKDHSYCVPKAVDVHVGHIRKKLEDDPVRPVFIATVRGVGYRFEDAPLPMSSPS